MSSTPRDWTVSDKRFLRSLRVVADAPAPPSKRFVVEPGMVKGEYHVIDREGRFHPHIFGKGWKIPRASADGFAQQMNEKHSTKKVNEDDA